MVEVATDGALRRAILLVAVLNLAYFGVEFSAAHSIGSVSLFADSVDFLEDASVNLLILLAIGWSARNRARLGTALAAILLIPGLATLWTIWQHFSRTGMPDPGLLSMTGLGALITNLVCAFILARVRKHAGSLTTAAFLSARNDALANIAIIFAGAISQSVWRSPMPDLIVGVAIAILNVDAAREVLAAARDETRVAAKP